MPEVIGEAVDLIVSIERAPGGRTVREILKVEGFRDGRYLTMPVGASKSESIQGRNLHVV
jgi:type IV secretion system protein VirB11